MKKVIAILTGCTFLYACSNNGGQGGVMNDGIETVDSNGGLADTVYYNEGPTDTSQREHRVDISKRDTFQYPPNK